jgi:photosystem II stability/assembly factor-like uncharacterized protein
MRSTRRGFMRGLVAMVAATALPMTARQATVASAAPASPGGGARTATARLAQGAEWQMALPNVAATRIFTPASGALFAATTIGLHRSDDGGANWTEVQLPPLHTPGVAIEVDPTDHRVVYVDTPTGLQRTDDDAATWAMILPSDRKTLKIAVSPADPSLVYVAQAAQEVGEFALLRSRDRGTTWETIEEQRQAPCGWSSLILTPHPTDSPRLFRTDGCYAGRNLGDDLKESRDFGSTWRTALTPKTAFPYAIVGGAGADPTRLYLAVNNDYRGGGSLLHTSSDDGATWTPILEHTGGGTMTGSQQPNVTIGGVAYNPMAPGMIFVGLNSRSNPSKPVDSSTVVATGDGGATWATLGQPFFHQIHDLKLGIDGQNLYAATANDVMRLTLG